MKTLFEMLNDIVEEIIEGVSLLIVIFPIRED